MVQLFAAPIQGWDPVRILSQIVSLQALHYIALALVTPPLLQLLSSNTAALSFEGGALQVGMVLDWRELAGRPTWDWDRGVASWARRPELAQSSAFSASEQRAASEWRTGGVWIFDANSNSIAISPDLIRKPGQRIIGGGPPNVDPGVAAEREKTSGPGNSPENAASGSLERWEWKHTRDPWRGWAIALAWAVTGLVDVFVLATLIRRPTHILDHTLTMHFIHLVLTSYYASELPTSLFWWLVMAAHAGACIVWAEQLAVRREMRDGLGHSFPSTSSRSDGGRLLGIANIDTSRRTEAASGQSAHVLFDEEAEADVEGPGNEGKERRPEELEMSQLSR